MLWLEGRAREGAQEATDASETVEEPERAEPTPAWGRVRRAYRGRGGGECSGGKDSGDQRKDHMHPHLAREATVRDVETTRYGWDYAGRRGKITHVDKDPQTGAAVGYVVRMEDGGDEVPFEPEEIQILEAWD